MSDALLAAVDPADVTVHPPVWTDQAILAKLGRQLAHPRQGVAGLQRRDDALGAGQAVERIERLVNLVGELSLHSVEARLARFLLGKADDDVMTRQPWATYAELAERFAVPLNTMRTWLRRSLIALKECLSR